MSSLLGLLSLVLLIGVVRWSCVARLLGVAKSHRSMNDAGSWVSRVRVWMWAYILWSRFTNVWSGATLRQLVDERKICKYLRNQCQDAMWTSEWSTVGSCCTADYSGQPTASSVWHGNESKCSGKKSNAAWKLMRV